jgi:hypothetical protein
VRELDEVHPTRQHVVGRRRGPYRSSEEDNPVEVPADFACEEKECSIDRDLLALGRLEHPVDVVDVDAQPTAAPRQLLVVRGARQPPALVVPAPALVRTGVRRFSRFRRRSGGRRARFVVLSVIRSTLSARQIPIRGSA